MCFNVDVGAKYAGVAFVQECKTKNKLKGTIELRQGVKGKKLTFAFALHVMQEKNYLKRQLEKTANCYTTKQAMILQINFYDGGENLVILR